MDETRILLDHGSGGKASHKLISQYILGAFDNSILNALDDGAVLNPGSTRLAFSTDTFVVDPLFFPGGDIGDLAVNGTVNDIAMCGAKPLYISVGLVVEEGFLLEDFRKVLASMRQAADTAGVIVVTGDTKVVPKGAADKMFVYTSGIGTIAGEHTISGKNVRPKDKVILSGTMADHGMAILTKREGLEFSSAIKSDTAALNHMVENILSSGARVRAFRDPTRGGVGTTLNEVAEQSCVGIRIEEGKLPVNQQVAAACELLGFDPLYVANEGKLLAFVAPQDADGVLEIMKKDPFGKNAAIIGEVVDDPTAKVFMQTLIGGSRIVDMLAGEQLPRIC